jgi:hypothetical protein
VSVQVCERFGVVPVGGDLQARTLTFATNDPGNTAHLQAVATACGFRVQPAGATTAAIEKAIRVHYYGDAASPPPAIARPAGAPAPGNAPAPGPAAVRPSSPATDLLQRVERLELLVRDPQFVAAALARIDRLEQMVARDGTVLRAIGDVLIEKGFVTLEEYAALARNKE